MSGKRRPRSKTGKTAAPAVRPPRRRRRWHPGLAILVVVIVVGGGLWAVRGRHGEEGTGAGALSAAEAHRRAQAAEKAGNREGALAIYREAVRTHPKDTFLSGNYAVAVSNGSFVVRTNRGRPVPLRPTSHDRVGDARAALALLDETERMDPKYAEPALQRGLIYAAWGLPEDALVEFYKAHLLGGRQDVIDRNASAITRLQLGAAAFDSLRQNGRPASR